MISSVATLLCVVKQNKNKAKCKDIQHKLPKLGRRELYRLQQSELKLKHSYIPAIIDFPLELITSMIHL
uniref:Uncharacterized protein n=1 Tax=Ciona intestinalis TaxID=7719 RepID=H2XQL3_CIOIN